MIFCSAVRCLRKSAMESSCQQDANANRGFSNSVWIITNDGVLGGFEVIPGEGESEFLEKLLGSLCLFLDDFPLLGLDDRLAEGGGSFI